MSAAKLVLVLLRAIFLIQLVLGLAFWSGRALGMRPMHQMIGLLFVVLLWVLAAIGAMRGAGGGLAALAVVWGLVIAALGFTQQGILIGDMHWIVRVLHLGVGIVAMPIAERLVARSGATVKVT